MAFIFEELEHVCEECGGHDWHANRFFCNSSKQWQSDDIAQWCSDCEKEVGLIPAEYYQGDEE